MAGSMPALTGNLAAVRLAFNEGPGAAGRLTGSFK